MLKYAVYKYTTMQSLLFYCMFEFLIDSCGPSCSVPYHSECLTRQTDCGLDHCCATRPCGLFLGQQTTAGSVGHLSLYSSRCPSFGNASVHTLWVKPQSMSDQSEDTIVFEWIPFLPCGSTRARIRTCCLESGRTSEFNKTFWWRWVTLCVFP